MADDLGDKPGFQQVAGRPAQDIEQGEGGALVIKPLMENEIETYCRQVLHIMNTGKNIVFLLGAGRSGTG